MLKAITPPPITLADPYIRLLSGDIDADQWNLLQLGASVY
jgi:hypothetical protein